MLILILFAPQTSIIFASIIYSNARFIYINEHYIKYYYHCSDIRNAYVNGVLPIFISAINGNGV